MSRTFIDAFADAMRAAQQAFNAGQFESAFVGLDPGVEWRSGAWVFDAETLRGRGEVISHFTRLRDAVDWQVEALDFSDQGGGRVIVQQRGRMRGRATNIQGTHDFFQLWEVGPGGRVTRVREFESRDDAIRAAELPE